MARPQKEGLDYFPLDTEMDDKIKLIDAKFGVAGFGVLIKLWQIIYDNGYYIKWTEKELLLYKTRINADINLINDVINECLRWEIFNNKLYETYSILTSSGIQKRYFEAVKRRTEITLVNEFITASLPENYKPAIKVIPAVIVCKNSKNADDNSQSKEKKSKEKKNINNMHGAINTPCQQPAIITLILNDKSEYPITQSQIDEWKDLYPAVDVLQQLKNMKGWLIANPTKRKTRRGILRFINSWLAREQDKGMQAPKSQLTKAPNKGNFDQRKYDNDYFDKLYKEV